MNPDSGSVAVADTRAVIPRCRISTRVYKKIGDIEVHVRHFEIGDCGPGLGKIAMITLSDVATRIESVTRHRRHYYANPAWTVIAPGTVNELEFIKEAERACIHWMTRLRHTLRPGTVHRMLRAVAPDPRSCSSSGILFIAGREAHIKRLNWRPAKQTR